MKKLLLSLCAIFCAGSMSAEIHENYAAPLLSDVQTIDLQPYFMFKAPAMGGTVWAANIGNENPMGSMSLTQGNTSFYNGGMNGMQLNEFPSTNSYTLTTAEFTLSAGKTYHLTYKDAGTRSSQNKFMTVSVTRTSSQRATIIDSYELQPCTSETNFAMYEHDFSFTVNEDAEDYCIDFQVANNGKSAGLMLQEVAITEDAPEGRGDLKGYNVVINGEQKTYFPANEATEGDVYLTYLYTEKLSYDVEYDFALQAVYEGGESPLSNVVTKSISTPTGVSAAQTAGNGLQTTAYDLQGRVLGGASVKGIILQGGNKVIR